MRNFRYSVDRLKWKDLWKIMALSYNDIITDAKLASQKTRALGIGLNARAAMPAQIEIDIAP